MAEIHQMVLDEGLFAVEQKATSKTTRRAARIAARTLNDDAGELAYTHPGLCLTILPYRPTPPSEVWQRHGQQASLEVHPIRRKDGSYLGVPYGSKARLILLYLQSEAIKTNSRHVELGRSMRQWLMSMGVSICGSNYRQVVEQAARIEHSLIVFHFTADGSDTRWQDSIIRGSFKPDGEDRVIELSEGYYNALQQHPVPLSEQAIKSLSNTCMPLDLYLFLAYRLHALKRPILLRWTTLHAQFGAGTQAIHHFKPRLIRDLELATSAYQEANVELTNEGLRLWPSPPPVAQRRLAIGS
jgi:Plasmid encoded RepA protein